MNAPLRHVAVLCIVMIMTLLVSTTYIQFVNADALNDDPRNGRTLIKQIGRHRGEITAGDLTLAESTEVDTVFEYQRRYPANQVYAHITGFYSVMPSSAELEKSEADALLGTDDAFFYRRISDLLIGKSPQGASVETTIQPRVQQAAWDALGNQRGAVIALNPQNGEILAMVSKPSYDPNVLAVHNTGQARAAYNELAQQDTDPLDNRTIRGKLYPSGSTFKIVMAAAALESGNYNADSMLPGPQALDLPGTSAVMKNANGRACVDGAEEVTLTQALVRSCNTPFGHLGLTLGKDEVEKQAQKFGFGQELEVPMKVTPATLGSKIDDRAVLAQTSIGERDVRVSPLQVAMFSAAVANNGRIMKPHLVKSVRAEDQTTLKTTSPVEFSRPMSANSAAQLRNMMQDVITDGTGKRAQIPGVTVAGKSGTAERSVNGRKLAPHAWFTAFAPAGDSEQAQVAVAVVVEEGGNDGSDASGGKTAGPIAQKVIKAVLGQ